MKNKLRLTSLAIQNFATIENQSINFDTGLNTIVGETGSGKSLILEALELIFGHRAKKQMIRKGSSFASVEAVIICNDEKTKEFIYELGHPFDGDEIVIKRVIYSTGKSSTYLNFQIASLQLLQTISKRFIDIVGQFENQKLLSSRYQLLLLDKYAKLDNKNNHYLKQYESYQNLKNDIDELKKKRGEQALKVDYLKYQISEIEGLNPSTEDENQLIETKNKLLGRQNKNNVLSQIIESLSENDTSILSQIKSILNRINNLKDTDLNELTEKIEGSFHQLEDVSFELAKELENEEDESINIQDIIDKLDIYQRLKRKFNLDTSELSNYLNGLNLELSEYQNLDEIITKKEKALATSNEIITKLANEIHTKRIASAHRLSLTLTKHIQNLNMAGAKLELQINKLNELTQTGISEIKFMAETNPGNGVHLVKDIASGGELSRILLAFRQVISTTDSISIFLFDEIDTGIGGHTALAIGQALSEVAKGSQVILITHLPQIAMFSNHLIQVTKKSSKNKEGMAITNSLIEEITSKKDRNMAIQRMNPTA